MDARQNTANSQNANGGNTASAGVTPVDMLTPQQQAWIDYNALGGLITDILDDDKVTAEGKSATMRKMPIVEFAKLIGVDRDTLRRWRTSIPDFWAKVNARRQEMGPQSRLQRVHEVWYLSALQPGNAGFRDRQLFLANFDPDFRMPTEEVKHELGDSWAALFAAKRKVIEGEVSDGPAADNPS